MLTHNVKSDKLELSHSAIRQGLSQATLDIAKVYCSLGHFQQAFDWCQSYLASYVPNDQLKCIMRDIQLRTDSQHLKTQIQKSLLGL